MSCRAAAVLDLVLKPRSLWNSRAAGADDPVEAVFFGISDMHVHVIHSGGACWKRLAGPLYQGEG